MFLFSTAIKIQNAKIFRRQGFRFFPAACAGKTLLSAWGSEAALFCIQFSEFRFLTTSFFSMQLLLSDFLPIACRILRLRSVFIVWKRSFLYKNERMCLGTFSRRGAVASATIYPCAECASAQSVFYRIDTKFPVR